MEGGKDQVHGSYPLGYTKEHCIPRQFLSHEWVGCPKCRSSHPKRAFWQGRRLAQQSSLVAGPWAVELVLPAEAVASISSVRPQSEQTCTIQATRERYSCVRYNWNYRAANWLTQTIFRGIIISENLYFNQNSCLIVELNIMASLLNFWKPRNPDFFMPLKIPHFQHHDF